MKSLRSFYPTYFKNNSQYNRAYDLVFQNTYSGIITIIFGFGDIMTEICTQDSPQGIQPSSTFKQSCYPYNKFKINKTTLFSLFNSSLTFKWLIIHNDPLMNQYKKIVIFEVPPKGPMAVPFLCPRNIRFWK